MATGLRRLVTVDSWFDEDVSVPVQSGHGLFDTWVDVVSLGLRAPVSGIGPPKAGVKLRSFHRVAFPLFLCV